MTNDSSAVKCKYMEQKKGRERERERERERGEREGGEGNVHAVCQSF
jgi:hypothetical protein